jgi:hypothetical protein
MMEEESDRIRREQLCPCAAKSRRTAAQKRYPLRHITILDLDPAAVARSDRTPEGETVLGRNRDQLVCPLAGDSALSDERNRDDADCQDQSQRRQKRQPASLGNRRSAPYQSLFRIAESEKDDPQPRFCVFVGVESDLMDKRAVGERIVEREHRFQMRDAPNLPANIRFRPDDRWPRMSPPRSLRRLLRRSKSSSNRSAKSNSPR